MLCRWDTAAPTITAVSSSASRPSYRATGAGGTELPGVREGRAPGSG